MCVYKHVDVTNVMYTSLVDQRVSHMDLGYHTQVLRLGTTHPYPLGNLISL